MGPQPETSITTLIVSKKRTTPSNLISIVVTRQIKSPSSFVSFILSISHLLPISITIIYLFFLQSSSMNSCSLGAPKTRISATNFSRLTCGNLLIPNNNQRLFIDQSPIKNLTLRTTLRSVKAIQLSTVSPIESQAIADVEDSEETQSTVVNTQLIPKASEVEALINEITDSSSIAEFELKLGGFRLYVARKLAEESSPPPQQIPHVVAASATPEEISTNGSATSSSLAITKTSSSSDRPQTLANKAADKGLVILQSPTVGYFRRSKTIKGKRTPTICKEKDIVKEGQVLCYIEQLGGQIPVESDVSGEIVKILREDGEPVGYNDALITVLPSFPGIKKLQ